MIFAVIAISLIIGSKIPIRIQLVGKDYNSQEKIDILNGAYVVFAMCFCQSDFKNVFFLISPLYLVTTIVLCLDGQKEST